MAFPLIIYGRKHSICDIVHYSTTPTPPTWRGIFQPPLPPETTPTPPNWRGILEGKQKEYHNEYDYIYRIHSDPPLLFFSITFLVIINSAPYIKRQIFFSFSFSCQHSMSPAEHITLRHQHPFWKSETSTGGNIYALYIWRVRKLIFPTNFFCFFENNFKKSTPKSI